MHTETRRTAEGLSLSLQMHARAQAHTLNALTGQGPACKLPPFGPVALEGPRSLRASDSNLAGQLPWYCGSWSTNAGWFQSVTALACHRRLLTAALTGLWRVVACGVSSPAACRRLRRVVASGVSSPAAKVRRKTHSARGLVGSVRDRLDLNEEATIAPIDAQLKQKLAANFQPATSCC